MSKSRLFDRDRATEIIHEYGSLSLRSWAQTALHRGVFSSEWRAQAELDQAMKDLARFAREDDEYGLPKFGPTSKRDDNKETLYAQRDMWDRSDWLLNIAERRDQGIAFLRRSAKLADAYEATFGEPCPLRPSIERILDVEYGDQLVADE